MITIAREVKKRGGRKKSEQDQLLQQAMDQRRKSIVAAEKFSKGNMPDLVRVRDRVRVNPNPHSNPTSGVYFSSTLEIMGVISTMLYFGYMCLAATATTKPKPNTNPSPTQAQPKPNPNPNPSPNPALSPNPAQVRRLDGLPARDGHRGLHVLVVVRAADLRRRQGGLSARGRSGSTRATELLARDGGRCGKAGVALDVCVRVRVCCVRVCACGLFRPISQS